MTKELLLSVVPGDDGEPVLHYASVNGRRIVKTGTGAPGYLPGPMRTAVFSLDSYFEHVDLAAPSSKLLPLVARRHVDGELVFDSPYRLRAISRAKRERAVDADISALPEHDLDAASALLPLRERPCRQMVPLELAIAALVRRATIEPIIVFWEKGGTLLSLLLADGMVQARLRESVDDDTRDAVIKRAEASLRASAGRYAQGRPVLLVLYTGDLCNRDSENRDKKARMFEERLAMLYRVGRGLPKDSVLRDPELYGLPFVDPEWNFLDDAYRDQVRSWQYARPAAAVAGLAGAAFALFGGFQHLQALGMASDFENRRAALSETLAEIERIRPSDQAMATVRSGLQLQMESRNEVRLDQMLDWLTHLVPDGVSIRALEVEPAPPPRQTRSTTPVRYAPGRKPFLVRMEIVLPETSFDAAEARSGEVVRRLSSRLQMVDSRLEVPAPEPGVRRNVVLMVDAQAHAADF